jgi:hypothetical protein
LHVFDEIVFSLADGKMYNRKSIEDYYDYDEILEDYIKIRKQMYVEECLRKLLSQKK